MRKPAIGILAGMGPRSTAPFIDSVVDECQRQYGASDDMDFPEMVILSLPTPFYAGRPVDHAAMRAALLDGLCDLEATGVAFIAMPCNTAHVYYEELRASIRVPLLNIVDETVRALPAGVAKAALFATASTVESGIYSKGLHAIDVECVVRPAWRAAVDGLLASIKAGGNAERDAAAMTELLDDAKGLGADCAIIGCTDLTPAARRCGAALPFVDSALCLAKATVNQYLESVTDKITAINIL